MKIAIYSRKSLETDTGESIKNQINICKEYFQRQHKDCEFEIFEDEGFSGGNTKRPSFQRMLTLIKAKQFNIVAVYKIDRIARNIVDFVNIFHQMEKYNVQLVSVTEHFDPATPMGKMMMLLIASFAEMERMNTSQRVTDNMIELAKLGRWSGGTAPFAYKVSTEIVNDKKSVYLQLDEALSSTVREVFLMYSKGYSTYEISDYLSEKGFKLNRQVILSMLRNPTYLKSSPGSLKYLESIGYKVYGEPNGCGFLPYNRYPNKKSIKLNIDKSKIVCVSKHEAIVDFDLWVKVHKVLESKFVAPHPRESVHSFLSGGLVKCKCGASMEVGMSRIRKDGTRRYYFRCTKTCGNVPLDVDIAEEYIDNFLQDLSDKSKLSALMNKKKPAADIELGLRGINKKISVNTSAINNLIDKLSIMTNEGAKYITDKIEQLSVENSTLKEELLKLEREKLYKQLDNANVDILYNQIQDYITLKDINEKRRRVKTIIENIYWDASQSQIAVRLISQN